MRPSWERGARRLRGSLPRLIWGGTVVACFALAGYVFWLVGATHEAALERARARTWNTVQLVEQHTARAFDTVELLLRAVSTELTTPGAGASRRIRALVVGNARAVPSLRSVSILDLASGTPLGRYDAHGAASPAVEEAAHRAMMPSAGRLLIDVPIKDEATGRWLLAVGFKSAGVDGPNLIVAQLDLGYFVNSFRAADTGGDGAVIVFRDDATVLARLPLDDPTLGQRLPQWTLFNHLARADAGTYETAAASDGTPRIVSYRRSRDLPLITLVGVSKAEVVGKEFLHEAAREVAFATLIMVLLVGLATLLVRQVERRESAEAGERLQTELFRTTIENIDQGLMMVDAEGRVRVSNQRAIELLGLPADLVTPGRPFEDIVQYQLSQNEYTPNLDPYRFWQSTRLLSGHSSYERTRPTGTVLDIRTVPLPWGGAVRTYTDITARRQAEKAVQESEARYRLLAENALDIIVRSTTDGRRLYVSPACREVLGYEPEELLQTTFKDTTHPDDFPLLQSDYERLIAEPRYDIARTYRVKHKAGHWLWVEARRRLVRAQTGEALEVVSVVRDVTDRQRQSEELQRAKETVEHALEEARKSSEAKSEFLAAMSHEIRTPLHSIIGFTSLLLEEPQPPDHRRKLELIQDSGTALLTLVDDILDFSKIEAGQIELEPQPFALPEFVEATASIVRGLAASKQLAIEVTLDPELPPVAVGDPDRIRQILLNLLNNAVKFTPAGSVALDVRCGWSGEVCFSVRDTGIGIPEHQRARLFERFTQVDSSIRRRFGGTGLGLAISKRLVELMGGRIGVESEPGAGSLFWFSIPLARADAAPQAGAPAAEAVAVTEPARILLVEDMTVNQEIARTVLEKAGHRVDLADNGEEAIKAVRTRRYDLVFMDIQMPVLDGLSATRRIRRLPDGQGQVPIVAMSANVLPDQIRTFYEAGVNDHVGKPFDARSLLQKVAMWVHGGPATTSEASGVSGGARAVPFDREVYGELMATLRPERLAALLARLQSQLTDPAVEDVLDSGDRDAIANYAHSVISAAGMLGFGEVSHRARALEDACRDGAEIEAPLQAFRAAATTAVDEMDRLEIGLYERARSRARRQRA